MTDDARTDGTTDSANDERIAALEAEIAKLRDIAARAQADLQNARARSERDADDLRKFAAESMMLRILPVIDNFGRAFHHVPEELKSVEWVKGVSAIEADLMKRMADAGLTRMESLGAVVDPHKHEVLSIGPGAQDTVVQVFEEGYELHGKTIRPAKVRAGDGSKV